MSHRSNDHGARWLHRLLSLVYGCLACVVVALAVWLVVSFPLWWPGAPRLPLPGLVEFPAAAWPVLDAAASPAGVEIDAVHGIVKARFVDPWHQWAGLLLGAASLALMALAVGLLRLIVGSLAQGDVFSRANARRLRWLGALMLAESLATPLFAILLSRWIVAGLTAGGAPLGVDWGPEIDGASFATAWVVLILSEVFRQGADLRDDQTLTV